MQRAAWDQAKAEGLTHTQTRRASLLEVKGEFVQYDVIAVVVVATAPASSLVDFLVFLFFCTAGFPPLFLLRRQQQQRRWPYRLLLNVSS